MSGVTAADASGLDNHGTLRGGPVWSRGLNNNALKFDGINDYVAISRLKYDRRGIPAVTVAAWLRTTKAFDQVIVSFDQGEYWQLAINGSMADDGQIGWLLMTDAGVTGVRSSSRIDDGSWHHVAGVFDNGRLTVCVDGAVSGTGAGGRSFGRGTTRYGFLGISSLADRFDGTRGASAFFNGELDDVRIYDRALSQAEISQLAFRGPANDACANAEPVGEVTNLPFDTRTATHDGPGLYIRSPNRWYRYAPTAAGVATVSLAGSQFDTMLAVYRGAEPNPGPDRVVGFDDDFDGMTSQLTFDVAAGQEYLIEVGGFDRSTGPGLLTITRESVAPPEFDLGDAPDGTNSEGRRMTAYADGGAGAVPANFPTVYETRAGQPQGPVHLQPKAVAHLGVAVSLEFEADKGADEDARNNLRPAADDPNQDGGDDGLTGPIRMPNGDWTSFDYVVNIIQPGKDLWVNVWCDWNRDGDWDDSSGTDPEMVSGGQFVSEWAVQNQYLFGLPTGQHQVSTPGFIAWHPDKGSEKIWMRITLSEKPWKGGANPNMPGNGGSGPAEGYDFGETEDYLITPEVGCSLCQDLNNDGRIDFDDLVSLMYTWLDTCPE